ncbi:IS701 family transposase [Streptomyces sp. M-16]|uniref:IS701 family transposase n=1 Tax=Streptomyces sp. M-16 TaxID=3233040 RepID=UPI003F97A490
MRAIRPVEAETPTRDQSAEVRALCTSVLGSLRRRDQRHKGELYVHGLLNTPGRKTMRNLAATTGRRSAEQSLHHFISCSTWDWSPLRAELTAGLERLLAPRAWVVRPLVIPKTGRHSVGVGRRFVPQLGQVVNSQHGYGLWLASGAGAAPVNWRLSLSGDWLDDTELRRRAAIPEDSADPRTAEALAVDMVLETAGWGASALPVVADAREEGVLPLVEAFSRARLPFLIRVGAGTGLLAPSLSAGRSRAVAGSAGGLAELARSQRRPVQWHDPAWPGHTRTSLVGLLPVRLPGGPPGPSALTLVGVWDPDRREVAELWLTGMSGAGRGALLGLGRLIGRADADFRGTSLSVGALDFEGRSYHGWHRHATLVSLAHASRLLGGGLHLGGGQVTSAPLQGGRRVRGRGRCAPVAAAGRAGVPVPGPDAASHGPAAG